MSDIKDLNIQPFPYVRPGGQQVSVVRTGIKVTHIPTGLIAIVECERSQIKNRNIAIGMINHALNQMNYGDTISN